jgi:hypothetical protein
VRVAVAVHQAQQPAQQVRPFLLRRLMQALPSEQLVPA